jgi:hypothetical protein
MKKIAIIVNVVLLTSLGLGLNSFAPAPNHAPAKHASKKNKKDGAPLLFWTNNCNYGAIEVFVNDVYQGDITVCYGSVPECASNGCVTVMIYGDNNVWTAQTKDGRRKWASKKVRLEDKDCNSECLL